MSIRMSSDEKYRPLRERMDEAARAVAQWPSWMIDHVERQRYLAEQEEGDRVNAQLSSAAQLDR